MFWVNIYIITFLKGKGGAPAKSGVQVLAFACYYIQRQSLTLLQLFCILSIVFLSQLFVAQKVAKTPAHGRNSRSFLCSGITVVISFSRKFLATEA